MLSLFLFAAHVRVSTSVVDTHRLGGYGHVLHKCLNRSEAYATTRRLNQHSILVNMPNEENQLEIENNGKGSTGVTPDLMLNPSGLEMTGAKEVLFSYRLGHRTYQIQLGIS